MVSVKEGGRVCEGGREGGRKRGMVSVKEGGWVSVREGGREGQ